MKPIGSEPDAEQLSKDMARYRDHVLAQGASGAWVIDAGSIPIDERVVLKCEIPRCFGYGTGANCPPNTLKPERLRALLALYRTALFFVRDIPPEVVVRDKATIKERVAAYQEMYRLVSELESMAFYDGHYLAFGLAAGSCRHTLCGREEDCLALKGERCRFALKSRPSMEAVGIDVYKLAAASGWEIYPIGSGVKSADVPKGVLAGLVVVA